MSTKKKVTLISPKSADMGLTSIELFRCPPQGLIQLASLTPLDWEVEIIDENQTSVNFNKKTDLVGLTAMTVLASRSYEIADEYRKRGIPVVMGGVHASALPNESLKHVDSVVIGEAEEIWVQVLNDFKRNKLKKIYKANRPDCLDFSIQREVQRTYPIHFSSHLPFTTNLAYIQTQRGCPGDCDFCSVQRFNGRRVRTKSLPYLLNEIDKEKEKGCNYIFFTDDNIVGNKPFAKSFFQELKKKKVKWFSQTDKTIADPDIIDLACDSGLTGVFIGLEALDPKILASSVSKRKEYWLPDYENAIKRLHKRGVMVMASFILGFDGESSRTNEVYVKWAIKNKVDVAQFTLLTPLPNTALWDRMLYEKRITTFDWSRYSFLDCVFKPIGREPEELVKSVRKAYQDFYSYSSYVKRLRLSPSQWFLSFLEMLELPGLISKIPSTIKPLKS